MRHATGLDIFGNLPPDVEAAQCRAYWRRATYTKHDLRAARKDKAARYLRNVLHDPDRADEVASESVEDYAALRHFMLSSPRKNLTVKEVKRPMPEREKLADVVADRDEILDKVEQLRDLADDILSEYGSDADDDSNNDDSDFDSEKE